MKSLSLFTVDTKTKTLSSTISKLGGFDRQLDQDAIKLVGDRVTNWYVVSSEKSEDNEITLWKLSLSPIDVIAYPECKKWKMVIFND